MVKNDMCLGSASKQNALFSENMPQKTYPGSRIDHAIWYVSSYINGNAYSKMQKLSRQTFTCSKSAIKHKNKMQNLLKVNTKRKNQYNQYHHINMAFK